MKPEGGSGNPYVCSQLVRHVDSLGNPNLAAGIWSQGRVVGDLPWACGVGTDSGWLASEFHHRITVCVLHDVSYTLFLHLKSVQTEGLTFQIILASMVGTWGLRGSLEVICMRNQGTSEQEKWLDPLELMLRSEKWRVKVGAGHL